MKKVGLHADLSPLDKRENAQRPQLLAPLKLGSRKNPELASGKSVKMPTVFTALHEITCDGLPRDTYKAALGGPGSGDSVPARQTARALMARPASQWRSRRIPAKTSAKPPPSAGISRSWSARISCFWMQPPRPESNLAGGCKLAGLLATIGAMAKRLLAKRIVFDSTTELRSLLDNIPKEHLEIYRLSEWLATSSMTGIITSKLQEGGLPSGQRCGVLQSTADNAVMMGGHTVERVSQRALRVLKFSGSAFSEYAAPIVIGPPGIAAAHISGTERTTRFQATCDHRRRTDGYDAGRRIFPRSNVLITRAPGTANSTLCGAFVPASCQQVERALYFSFDENRC